MKGINRPLATNPGTSFEEVTSDRRKEMSLGISNVASGYTGTFWSERDPKRWELHVLTLAASDRIRLGPFQRFL